MTPWLVLVPALTVGCSALPRTLQPADGDLSLFISWCSAPSLRAVGAGFPLVLFLPEEWGGCHNCKNLLLKFRCQTKKK